MTTERIFYQDPHGRTFTATVLDCIHQETGYAVILDRTCFYPEGGGQPGDQGTLDDIRVTDTQEDGETVLHMTEGPLEIGSSVTGNIDWDRRFDLMQQHSGEHMVSGVIHRIFGYDNVGFHMGADVVTIDFSGILTEKQLAEVEAEVNCLIWEDRAVKCWYPDPETLRTIPYRSKKELSGTVRIVEFPGADVCACCGTHVARTGEIGLVKILGAEKFHSGVRVEMLAGRRAYKHVSALTEQNRQVSRMLSAKPLETAGAVQALSAELEAKKQRIYAMEQAMFREKAEELRGKGDVLVRFDGLTPDGVRRAAIAIQETCGGRAAVFTGDDENGYKYAAGNPGGDLREWVRELNAALSGRGGGKAGFVQGSVSAKWEEIATFMTRS